MPRKMFESDEDYRERLHREAKKNSKAKAELDRKRTSPRGWRTGGSMPRGSKPSIWRGGSRNR